MRKNRLPGAGGFAEASAAARYFRADGGRPHMAVFSCRSMAIFSGQIGECPRMAAFGGCPQ